MQILVKAAITVTALVVASFGVATASASADTTVPAAHAFAAVTGDSSHAVYLCDDWGVRPPIPAPPPRGARVVVLMLGDPWSYVLVVSQGSTAFVLTRCLGEFGSW